MHAIDAREVEKAFGATRAVGGASLEVGEGELVALLGPSGSGKTTLLRVIAGLDAPDAGRVLFAGADATAASPRERRVGFVFQHYALFRHLTVFENVAFGLRVRPRRQRLPEAEIRDRVRRLLSLVQIDGLADRLPSHLSGGQRQRVALARALAVEPRVLLLDEPFGALDAKVRKELRRWLRRLHDDLHVTSLFVTHDQDEALEVADRIVVMNHGRVEQVGTPEEVYSRPASPFVLDFLGDVNLFRCRIEEGRVILDGRAFDVPGAAGHRSGQGRLYVRPHVLSIDAAARDASALPARVLHVNRAGPIVRVELETLWGDPVRVELGRERLPALPLAPGEHVFLHAEPDSLYVVPDA